MLSWTYFDEAASVLEMFIADALPADKVKGLLNKKKTNSAPAPISGSISSSSITSFYHRTVPTASKPERINQHRRLTTLIHQQN
jgi:hypothetical protein